MLKIIIVFVLSLLSTNLYANPLYLEIDQYVSDNIKGENITDNADSVYKELVSHYTKTSPLIDGDPDQLWANAQSTVLWDRVAKRNVVLKSLYTDTEIFFMAEYADVYANIDHKAWHWDNTEQMYVEGPEREDTFVFKWSMTGEDLDLSVYADNEYRADIWFWKACRTNSLGYADDKMHILSEMPSNNSTQLISRSGKKMYLKRLADKGAAAYKSEFPVEYSSDIVEKYRFEKPLASRADVRSKGKWANGKWVVEFSRKLKTANDDDVQFYSERTYYFGFSLFEIAAKNIGYGSEQPLYGCGDVYNKIKLTFE